MRIIAFITEASTVRKILDHLGEATLPPCIAPASGPPLWEAAMASEQAGNDPEWGILYRSLNSISASPGKEQFPLALGALMRGV